MDFIFIAMGTLISRFLIIFYSVVFFYEDLNYLFVPRKGQEWGFYNLIKNYRGLLPSAFAGIYRKYSQGGGYFLYFYSI